MSNYNCVDLYCTQNCCAQNGYCPNASSNDGAQNTCYYYYGANTVNSGYTGFNRGIGIPFIIVGGIVVILFFIIMWWCWKRRNQRIGMPQLTIAGQPVDPAYGPGYGGQYAYGQAPPPIYPAGAPTSGDYLVYNQMNTNQFNHPNPGPYPVVPPGAGQNYNPYSNNNPASYNTTGWNNLAAGTNPNPNSNPMNTLANSNTQQYLNTQKGYPTK